MITPADTRPPLPGITLGAEVDASGATVVAIAASGAVVDVRQLWQRPDPASLAHACQVLGARWSQPVFGLALACDDPQNWLVLPDLFRPAGPQLLTIGRGTARALAEFHWGALRGSPDCLVVTIGARLGAGALRQGLPLLPQGRDLELAHLPIVEDGPVCTCGRRGCLHAVATESAWHGRARDAGIAKAQDVGADLASPPQSDLGARAARGDAVTLTALAEPIEQLARGIAILAGAIGVGELALQWPGTGSGDRLQQQLMTRIRHWWPTGRAVAAAQTGAVGAAWGAALWAQQQRLNQHNS